MAFTYCGLTELRRQLSGSRPAGCGAALLLAVFVVNVYRAATQSFTTDEAFSYLSFVAVRTTDMAWHFDANNHVLNTFLSKLTVKLLGPSEFGLRLPSILGGGLYLLAVWALARKLFQSGWKFIVAVSLLSLNPLVLDYLSAARGYGLALAFFTWALVLLAGLLEAQADWRSRKLPLAGAALGLSVAANLTFALPASALALCFIAASFWRRETRPAERIWTLIDHFALPGLAVVFMLLFLPMNGLRPGAFYFGSPNVRAAVGSLILGSFFHGAEGLPAYAIRLVDAATVAGVALLLAAALFALRREASPLLRLTAGTMLLTAMALVALHHLMGTPYPHMRTGLYWIPLLTIAAMALPGHTPGRGITTVAAVAGALVVAAYLAQFNVRYYQEWRFDAGAKRLLQTLAAETGNRPLQVWASFPVDTTVEYYRRRLKMTRWRPVVREPAGAGIDYYVLLPADHRMIAGRHLRVVASGGPMLLARP